MTELIQTAFSPINLLFTILLMLVILYWLSIIIGALDIGSFDLDFDFDADVDVDLDADGLELDGMDADGVESDAIDVKGDLHTDLDAGIWLPFFSLRHAHVQQIRTDGTGGGRLGTLAVDRRVGWRAEGR